MCCCLELDLRKVETFILWSGPVRRAHLEKNIVPLFDKATLFEGTTKVIRPDDHMPESRGAKGMLAILTEMADRPDFSPFMILEDDVDVHKFYTGILKDNNTLKFSYPEDADALYLGLSTFGLLRKRPVQGGHSEDIASLSEIDMTCAHNSWNLGKDWVKVLDMLASHAIVVTSKRFMNFMIRAYMHSMTMLYCKLKVGYDIPVAMHQKDYNVYALKKPVFYQRKYVRPDDNGIFMQLVHELFSNEQDRKNLIAEGQVKLGGQEPFTNITVDDEHSHLLIRPELYYTLVKNMVPGHYSLYADFEPFAPCHVSRRTDKELYVKRLQDQATFRTTRTRSRGTRRVSRGGALFMGKRVTRRKTTAGKKKPKTTKKKLRRTSIRTRTIFF